MDGNTLTFFVNLDLLPPEVYASFFAALDQLHRAYDGGGLVLTEGPIRGQIAEFVLTGDAEPLAVVIDTLRKRVNDVVSVPTK